MTPRGRILASVVCVGVCYHAAEGAYLRHSPAGSAQLRAAAAGRLCVQFTAVIMRPSALTG